MSKRGQNEGTIVRRSDGRFCGAVSLGFEGGRRKRRYVYGATREEVARKVTGMLRTQHVGQVVPSGKGTLGELLDIWLAHVAAQVDNGDRKPKTLAGYRRLVEDYIRPQL